MLRSRRLVLPAVVLLSLAVSSCQWAMYGFDAGRSGVNPGEHWIDTTNVDTLVEQWTAPVVGPTVIARGVVYVATGPGCCVPRTANLFAFQGNGVGCGGANPKVCGPLWVGKIPKTVGMSTPVVVHDIVYVAVQFPIAADDRVYAFDATGTNGCSGTPKLCQPLWSAPGYAEVPFVDDGELFVHDPTSNNDGLVYDAAGSNGCAGSPKTCIPLFRLHVECGSRFVCINPQPMAAMDGKVYFATGVLNEDDTQLPSFFVFSEDGTDGCSGSPKVCQPLSATMRAADSTIATDGYVVTTASEPNPFNGNLTIIQVDAPDPVQSWYSIVEGVLAGKPAVTASTIYLPTDRGLTAFALAPPCGSSCMPCTTACQPLWQAPSDSPMNPVFHPAATVANGVVYDERGRAFDAAGAINCSGSPKVCTPLASYGSDQTYGETQVDTGWLIRAGLGNVTGWQLPTS
jgi:PQQ-like domain